MYVTLPYLVLGSRLLLAACTYTNIQQLGLSPLFIWFDPDHVQENEALATRGQLSEVGSSYHTSGEQISLRGGGF